MSTVRKRALDRVRNAIKRLQAKGFTTQYEPSQLKELSTEELTKMTTKSIQESSTYYNPETDDILTHEEYKAQQKQRAKDARDKKKLEEDLKYQVEFSQGYMIYETIKDRLEVHAVDAPNAVSLIRNELQIGIDTYGFDNYMIMLSNASEEVIDATLKVISYEGRSDRQEKALNSLHAMITGRAYSAEESAKVYEELGK